MYRFTTGAVAAVATVATLAAPAGAVQVEPPTRDRGADRVSYVEKTAPRRFWLETADGAAYKLRPCRWEDDARPCVWDATRRGNRRGMSFAVLVRGADPVRIPRRMMRRA